MSTQIKGKMRTQRKTLFLLELKEKNKHHKRNKIPKMRNFSFCLYQTPTFNNIRKKLSRKRKKEEIV